MAVKLFFSQAAMNCKIRDGAPAGYDVALDANHKPVQYTHAVSADVDVTILQEAFSNNDQGVVVEIPNLKRVIVAGKPYNEDRWTEWGFDPADHPALLILDGAVA